MEDCTGMQRASELDTFFAFSLKVRITEFTEQKVIYIGLIGSCWCNHQNENLELLSLVSPENFICNKLVKFKWGKYAFVLKILLSSESSFSYSAL